MLKALILVGGYGTRLRPLTLTTPKPLIEFCNKPILFYQIEALVKIGVKRIVLAVSYMSEMLNIEKQKLSKNLDVEIILSAENVPLGTAGPLAFAREYLQCDNDPIFVLNSDIICKFPFDDILSFHLKHEKLATLAVTKVIDPSKYGVVVTDENNKVCTFVEKPSNFISNNINAGIYILNPKVIDLIEPVFTSIERETFPKLVLDNNLYAFELSGFWADIGQPKDYLNGVKLYLQFLNDNNDFTLCHGDNIFGNVIIDKTAKIGQDCHIGPNVVIGPNTIVENGVYLSNCVIMKNSIIKSFSYINTSIIGTRCKVGCWARLEDTTVLGEDVNVHNEVYLKGCKILPHKEVSISHYSNEIIM